MQPTAQPAREAADPWAEAAREVARALAGATGEPATPLWLAPLRALAPPRRVAAVDGSNADVLKGQALTVSAYRAGYLVVEDARLARESMPAPALALVPANAPPEARAEALRERAERDAAREALTHLSRGDLLLLDGPVRDAQLLARALAQGVAVVGVSKSTRITLGGAPAVLRARKQAREAGLVTFACEAPVAVPNAVAPVFLARLSAAEPWVFRFDVQAAPGEAPADALARVAGLAAHPAYPGYPSPLAMAHNRVVIDDALQTELAQELRRRCEDLGVAAEVWELAFTDYHDVIELGA